MRTNDVSRIIKSRRSVGFLLAVMPALAMRVFAAGSGRETMSRAVIAPASN